MGYIFNKGICSSMMFAPQNSAVMFTPQWSAVKIVPQWSDVIIAPQWSAVMFTPQRSAVMFAVQSEVALVKMPSRLQKRKAKRREEYHLNRDYELESSRVWYDAERRQASACDMYRVNLESNRAYKRR